MASGRKLLAGASWIYGAQALTVFAQFAYAAVTSRLVGPEGFGAYAIALSVSGLVTLVTAGGLSQAVSRMTNLDKLRLRALSTFALVLGLLGAAFLWISAAFWASLWGDGNARPAIELLAVSVLMAPLAAIATSLLRRQGSFRALAIVTLAANLLGMVIGAAAVAVWRTGWSLAASALAAQLLLLLLSTYLCGRILWGVANIKHARSEIAFSSNLSPIKFTEYFVGNILKWSVSRFLGSANFGYWNRGDMLATLPFQQVQMAVIQAVSPEFRNDIESPVRAHRVWTDLQILVAWFAFPLSAAAAIVLPLTVPLLFGPGWEQTSVLIPYLAVAAGLQMVSTVLASAVEMLGRYKWLWMTSGSLILFQLVGVCFLLILQDIAVAMMFLIATHTARHAVQVSLCGKHGYLDIPRLMKNYLASLVFALLLSLGLWISFWVAPGKSVAPVIWLGSLLIAVVVAVSLFKLRMKFPPWVIASRYGFIKGAGA